MRDSFVAPTRSCNSRLLVLLPLAGYVVFIGKGMFTPVNVTWALLLLGWTVGVTVLAWWLTRSGDHRLLSALDRHASRIAIGMVAVAAVVLVVISVLQARHFAMGMRVVDSAYYSQILWNTLQGDFLYGNLNQERLYNPPVSSDLALHVSPILAGVLPVYALFPHFLTLLVLRDVALVAASWPLFLLARDCMGGVGGIAAVALYLANPVIMAQSFQEFTPLQFAPLAFFWTLRAFVRDHFGGFIGWMGAGLTAREDVAITMAGFGLWALVSRRRPRWAVIGLGIPVLWWGLTTLVIQPAFGHWGNNVMEIESAGGHHPTLGMYQLLLTNPAWIFERNDAFEYLYRVFRSVGFVGILGGAGLVAAPPLTTNVAVGGISYYGVDPISRLAILPSCAVIGAAVLGATRIARRWGCEPRAVAVIVLALMPSASLLDGGKDAVREGLGVYTVWNDAGTLSEGLGYIPTTASVAAPGYALPALAHRAKLFFVPQLHMYPDPQVDYLLLDRDADRVTSNPELQARYLRFVDQVLRSTDYETVWQHGPYAVLRQKM